MIVKRLLIVAIAAAPASDALAGFTLFSSREAFRAYNMAQGKTMKFFQDFEAVAPLIPPGSVFDVPPGGFLDVLDPVVQQPNLKIQSNMNGQQGALGPGHGLRFLGAGAIAAGVPNSVVLGTRYPHGALPGFASDSLDLLFDPNHTGVASDVIDPSAAPRVLHITVYDKNGNQIVKHDIGPGDLSMKTFFGIWSVETISRINIAGGTFAGANNGAEYIDNIEAWIPAPSALAVLCVAGVVGSHRRGR